MLLLDVNVLVYVHRSERPEHGVMAPWLTSLVTADAPFGVSDLVFSSFLRIVTSPRVFEVPTPLDVALGFVSEVRNRPNHVEVRPGPRHWSLFTSLCERTGAKGNLIADAYLAAIAIESGCEWITTDRDFARFPDLRWRHPLD